MSRLYFDGITFRQALNERANVFWPMLAIWPFYFYTTFFNAWAGVAWLGLILLPTALIYFKWKHDNKPRTPFVLPPPLRNPAE